jgi:hypothetical protein
MTFVSFPWSPVVASLSISMFCFLFTHVRKRSFLIYTLLLTGLSPKEITQHQALVKVKFTL